jgi:hypothetical protein
MSVTVDGRFGNAPPDRSLAQRMAALEKGNVHRVRRAQLKRDVKAGRVLFADVLLEPIPEHLASMKLVDLMLAVPKVGRVKTNRIMSRVVVSPSKTLGGLSERQRTEIVSMVRR